MRTRDVTAVAIVLLALALRLREPFSSPVIGAEDPYLRMANTWDLVQGRGFSSHYPPGFSLLLAPFALMGPSAFYAAARFGPPFLGAIEVAGIYWLARGHVRPVAALVAALALALTPENIFRTNLLFPTALDLALLPWLFGCMLRGVGGSRRAWGIAAALLTVLLLTHPWVVALVVPALALFALSLALRDGKRALPLAGGAAAAGAALLATLWLLPGTWNPTHAFFENAGPQLATLAADPAGYELPVHVNFHYMLTIPLLALGIAGAFVALWRRERFDLLALAWAGFILPFVLVDWFDIWFLPHRSVAYLSIGVAMLAALPFDAVARATPAPAPLRIGGAATALGIVALVMMPSALGLGPWYRLYEEDDYDAWHAVAARRPAVVVTAAWQTAEGYRAITGQWAVFNPAFFEDREMRAAMLREEPDTVVLIDDYAREGGLPRDFVHDWEKLGEWDGGRVKAYLFPG